MSNQQLLIERKIKKEMGVKTSQLYRSFSQYLRERFGTKVYRVSLDAGFTCPNRDGTLGWGGCAYCSPEGSWGGRAAARNSLNQQVRLGKEIARKRYGAKKFIAYFQAFTNTYAPVEKLKEIYDSVIGDDEEFVGIAIGTRPDCIDRDKLELIASYRKPERDVWIEYGLQSAHSKTLRLINRGHDTDTFRRAVLLTKEYGLLVSAHIIIGLPGEGLGEVIETTEFIAKLPLDGIKIHNLNIVKNTLMAQWYKDGKVVPLKMDDYVDMVIEVLKRLNPAVVVQRLVAESNRKYLLAPMWSLKKQLVLTCIHERMSARHIYQGKLYKV